MSILQARLTNSPPLTRRTIHFVHSSRWLPSKRLVSSSTKSPLSSNFIGANAPTRSPGLASTKEPVSASVCCSYIWVLAVPDLPPAPTIAAGMPISDPSPLSRDAQSITFFNAPDVP